MTWWTWVRTCVIILEEHEVADRGQRDSVALLRIINAPQEEEDTK